jgi:hypothetical protein
MTNVLSDFTEASLLFFLQYTADAPAQLALSKMGERARRFGSALPRKNLPNAIGLRFSGRA